MSGAEFTEMRYKMEYFNQILEDCIDEKVGVIFLIGALWTSPSPLN